MSLKQALIAFGSFALSTSLFARTPECTNLDKAHWIPAEKMQKKLVEQGYRVIDFDVADTCYRVRLEERGGQKVDAFYHPVGGYPLRRQAM